VLRRLSKEQRQLLHESLWRWRQNRLLTPGQRADWTKLLKRLNQNWNSYFERVQLSIADEAGLLTQDQRKSAATALAGSQAAWQAEQMALAEASSGTSISGRSREVLDDLQRILDLRAWAMVEDNTVLRSAESDAWHRCWEQLESLDASAKAEALGPLNYVQLFAQSTELRAQVVKIRGTVRRAYRVRSQVARFGIEEYVVLAVLPGDNSGSPIAVYCVKLPDGFPDIGPVSSANSQMALDEDVEITGYYFKRWLHRSEGGMNLSPLLLGEITRWAPHDRLNQPQSGNIPPHQLLFGTLAVALVAILVAILVYRSSRWSSTEVSQTTQPPQVLPEFEQQQVRGNVSDMLRQVEDGPHDPAP
jgi:hypothetical protein